MINSVDKGLANRLINFMENMLAENLLLRSQINAFHHAHPESPTAVQLTADSTQNARVSAVAKDMFHPLRAEVERAMTLDRAIERILLSLPASQKPS